MIVGIDDLVNAADRRTYQCAVVELITHRTRRVAVTVGIYVTIDALTLIVTVDILVHSTYRRTDKCCIIVSITCRTFSSTTQTMNVDHITR